MGERHSDEQSDKSKDESVERLTIIEAAEKLGVSRDAVYKRVRRGSIASDTGIDGLLYVYIKPSIYTSTEASDVPSEHVERLLQAQEREIEYLRGQLGEEREARRRADHIIAALTERIPELEAPPQSAQEAEDVAESAAPDPDRGESSFDATEAQGGARRPWWRRWFGG